MARTRQYPTKPQPRKYAAIWDAISAAEVGKIVSVRVHETAAKTVRQAVCKEKSRETAERKRLGMFAAGKLIITETPDKKDAEFVILNFSLEWDGRRL
jgi:hypothetical protein